MLRNWEKSQAVYAPMLTNPVPRANVAVSFVCGVAEPCSLFGGKVAALLLGYIEEIPLTLRGLHNTSNYLNHCAKYEPEASIWRVLAPWTSVGFSGAMRHFRS
jgi:hypothetical protein